MMIRFCLVSAFCLGAAVRGDFIELRDGRRLEGVILEEKPDALTIEVGRNPEGTIRQLLIIHASEIRSWAADPARRAALEEGGDAPPPARLSGKEFVDQLLREGEDLVGRQEFDSAISRFQEAADLAVQESPDQTPVERVEALELRAHALKLLVAALDGKLRHLNMLARGGESDIRAERQRLEREWATLEADKRREQERRDANRRIELGQRATREDFSVRETELRRQIALLNERETHQTEFTRQLESERSRTESQRDIARERVRQAETQAREARRQLQRMR